MSNYSNIDYEKFINDLNSGLIVSAEFSFKNYAHYKNCVIEKGVLKNSRTGAEVPTIKVRLTKDGSEKTEFLYTYKESYKLFRIKGKTSLTLKQAWTNIEFTEIKYAKSNIVNLIEEQQNRREFEGE